MVSSNRTAGSGRSAPVLEQRKQVKDVHHAVAVEVA